jgi:hypothetical protein
MNKLTLKDVIEDFKITIDSDDYINNTPDHIIRNIALRGIREFGFDMSKQVKSLKLQVEDNNTVALPDDYVDMIKLGIVGSDGLVYVFAENKNINYSHIKKDTNDTFFEGPMNIEANAVNDIEESKSGTESDSSTQSFYQYVFENFMHEGGVGRLYGMGGGHLRGEYRINLDQNRIELSQASSRDEVVMEYVSDAARSGNPQIHVYLEEALRSYIYYKLIERKSSVPANEKARARQEYYNERRKANARMSNFTKENALNVIRKNFKQSPKY